MVFSNSLETGSNLKFYKTDSGTLEVMTQSEDEDENDEFVNGGGGSSNRGNHSSNHASSRVSDEDDIQHEVNFDQDGGTGKMTRRNRRGNKSFKLTIYFLTNV